ncbi:hypothetical protein BT96DRAFT_993933 [Gymnopus androsaceus JB14]|uniref:Prefoldin subunit 5 n=1 Tax=Gymnopus androsaceus JB14 TaxID=1447944 RepID=A0A6A4HN13_9AGAR|nr:hypothetical protein BT96DRAFT_993933 [Gymnopus androsaceus JB14]
MLEMLPKIQQEPNGHSAVTPESGLGFALTPFLTFIEAACCKAAFRVYAGTCFGFERVIRGRSRDVEVGILVVGKFSRTTLDYPLAVGSRCKAAFRVYAGTCFGFERVIRGCLRDVEVGILVVGKFSIYESNHLTTSFAQLKQAQAKFKTCIEKTCIENVAEMEPENQASFLVKKSCSCPFDQLFVTYVPGKLSDPEHVLVDVGTGYFIQKTRPQATKHYQAKVDFIRTNLETLEDTIQKKRDNMSAVVNVI